MLRRSEMAFVRGDVNSMGLKGRENGSVAHFHEYFCPPFFSSFIPRLLPSVVDDDDSTASPDACLSCEESGINIYFTTLYQTAPVIERIMYKLKTEHVCYNQSTYQ